MKSQIKQWFNKVVNNYERPLTRYALNILKALPQAQEVVQEGFLRLWKNGVIDEENLLKVWLYKTCRNLSIDIIRKEGRMSSLTQEQEEGLLCPADMPSQKIEKEQLGATLLNYVNQLPEKSQEVVRLKFQEQLSYKQISQITGYTSSQVGVLLHRSILHLRQSIIKGAL